MLPTVHPMLEIDFDKIKDGDHRPKLSYREEVASAPSSEDQEQWSVNLVKTEMYHYQTTVSLFISSLYFS